jgi:TPR repeat protein
MKPLSRFQVVQMVQISFLGLGIVSGLAVSSTVVSAQTTYPVFEQSAAYPLTTQVSPAQLAEFNQIFQFGKFDPKKAIALRPRLLPLATAGDPVACYWLAKTYDWYEFGVGRVVDRPSALKWYRQAANLNYAPAAYLLHQTYFYGFMNVKKDEAEALKWLNRAKETATGDEKVRILTDFARFSDPDKDATTDPSLRSIPKNIDAHLEYLRQAHAINPKDTWVADYYGDSLYKAQRYTEALTVLSQSDNAYTWRKLGEMYEQGLGTAPDLSKALFWYKKMSIEGEKQENDLNPIRQYGRHEIFRLVCLKKITPQQAAPVYTPEGYETEFKRWSDDKCVLSPG